MSVLCQAVKGRLVFKKYFKKMSNFWFTDRGEACYVNFQSNHKGLAIIPAGGKWACTELYLF